MTGWSNIDAFLNERLVEREAEHAALGDTFAGQLGSLHVAVLSLVVEVVKTVPLPRGVRRRMLERLAEHFFGDHPEFSEWWRR